VLPHPQRRISDFERRLFRRLPLAQRLLRGGIYTLAESLGLGITVEPRLLAPLEQAARAHLRRQIADPDLRRKLEPDYRIGCKRILLSNTYFPALTQPNAELVTEGIESVGPRSILTRDGAERTVDTILLGTGFRILDFSRLPCVRGKNGGTLAEAWGGRPEAYLGTTVAGFPNLFTLVGPHTGLGHNSLLYMIESQIAYVIDTLRTMQTRGLASVEVRPEVQAAYNAKLQARSSRTVWLAGGCSSWYLNEAGENASLWPGFTFTYRRLTRRFKPAEYLLAGAGGSA
jgi:cation diffusion facilitator CzcD-associated flavoprotein CzcO